MVLFFKGKWKKGKRVGFWSHPLLSSHPTQQTELGRCRSLLPRVRGGGPRPMFPDPVAPVPTFTSPARRGPLPCTPLCGVLFRPLRAWQSVPSALSPSIRVGQLVGENPVLPSKQDVEPDPVVNSHLYAACFWLMRPCRGDCMK